MIMAKIPPKNYAQIWCKSRAREFCTMLIDLAGQAGRDVEEQRQLLSALNVIGDTQCLAREKARKFQLVPVVRKRRGGGQHGNHKSYTASRRPKGAQPTKRQQPTQPPSPADSPSWRKSRPVSPRLSSSLHVAAAEAAAEAAALMPRA